MPTAGPVCARSTGSTTDAAGASGGRRPNGAAGEGEAAAGDVAIS